MKLKAEVLGKPYCYFSIPEKIAKQFLDKKQKRIICKIDNGNQFHCAIQRSNARGYYLMLGKKTLKAIQLEPDQKVVIELIPDNTKYQALIPEALEEVLKSDFEAYEKFHALTLGKQRSIIYMVTGVKSQDKQIERALKIMENIKLGITNNRELLK